MRMNPRYTRVRDMITAVEVPRQRNGGILLCHFCQRRVHFAGGFLNYLIDALESMAKRASYRKQNPQRA